MKIEKKEHYGLFETIIDFAICKCYTVKGDFMLNNMEKITILNAYSGISVIRQLHSNRPSHVLIFKIDGESLYTFADKAIQLSAKEVLFIPKGANYLVQSICQEEGHYALINFHAEIEHAMPRKYRLHNFEDALFTCKKLIKIQIFQKASGHYEALSLFYKILSQISLDEEKEYCNAAKRNIIAPAIKYLEEHIFDCDLKTEKLHELCGVSDTYFRKIFISDFGVSPKQYIIKKRLNHARNMLESGDFVYVYEVAEAVGYTDPLYFSRLFKKYYGITPSNREEIIFG